VTALAGAEAIILALRFGFAVSLYLFVTVAILALQRSLRGPSTSRTVTARLVLVGAGTGGDIAGRTVALVGATVTIGRAPTNDVVVRDDSVSGKHAQLAWFPDGWVVADVGSRNGTTVNGSLVRAEVGLSHGDEVGTGALTWRFETRGPTGAIS
jgi:hypothetical protein